MKLLAAALLAGAVLLSGPAAGGTEVRLVGGLIPGFCEKEGNSAGGVSCALVAEMAKRVGHGGAYEVMPMGRAIETARRGRHLIALGRNARREEHFQWKIKLFEEDFILLARAGSPVNISTVEAARKLTIGVMIGGMSDDITEEAGFIHVQKVADERINARKLDAGRIDAWLGSYNSTRHAQLAAGLPEAGLQRGATVRHVDVFLAASLDVDAAELQKWQSALEAMRKDGTYARILKQYDYSPPAPR